jgi:type IX secretion system PorP/SprF family membrane protein
MRKYLLILIYIAGLHDLLVAQQMSMVSLFSQNQTYYNPGATGNLEVLTANFFYRQNWVGYTGAPSTQVFSVHAPMKNPAVAMGIMLEHEMLGAASSTGFYLNYAYRLSLGANRLAFGLKAGISNFSQTLNQRDDQYDPALDEDNYRFIIPNFGFGILFTGNKYWVGLSAPRIFGFETKTSGKYGMYFDMNRLECYASAGGMLTISSDFAVEPSVLFGYTKVFQPRIAVNALAVYKRSYKAGLGYRVGEALIILLGYNLNRQFSLGYSYDMNIGELSKNTSGSHEINVQYKFGYRVNASNPRDF